MKKNIKPKLNSTIPKVILKKIPKVSRSQIITQRMVGRLYRVHNGKTFTIIVATNLKLGLKFGEFVFTKKSCIHKKKKKKKK